MNETYQDLERAMREYFEMIPKLSYKELRERVLSGYEYSISSGKSSPDTRNITLRTGKGGVLQYIDVCEKTGFPASVFAESIICYTDEGAYPLSQLKVKKNESSN